MTVLAVVTGAFVQGLLGFGLALVAVPVLAWALPWTVPEGVLVAVLPLVVVAAVRERRHADVRGVGWALLGRLPGGVAGGALVVSLGVRGLQLLVAVSVLGAVAAAVAADRGHARAAPTSDTVPPRPGAVALAAAGALSGLGGTVSGVGGPPMALVYRHHAGAAVRATLSGFFVVGALLSLATLGALGALTVRGVVAGLALVPAVAVGYLLSGLARSSVDTGWLRPVVLAVSAAAGLGLLVRAVLG